MDDFVANSEAGRLATLAYAELTLDTGVLRYACAGHPPPLLLAPDREPRFLWDGRSGPLGTTAASRTRKEGTCVVPPGSRLLLYTDGLVERHGEGLKHGLDRLADRLVERRDVPLAVLGHELTDAMLAHDGGHDDLCLLALDFNDAPRFHAEFPALMSRLAGLRHDLGEWLVAQGVEEYERFGLVLACSEAAANAVQHGCAEDPAKRVSVTATIDDGVVELHVSDTGRWRTPRTTAERGRGLSLMGRLVDDLVVDRGAGTSVLMRRTLGGSR
jgi:serine/threonine-protein kinase RsbW